METHFVYVVLTLFLLAFYMSETNHTNLPLQRFPLRACLVPLNSGSFPSEAENAHTVTAALGHCIFS